MRGGIFRQEFVANLPLSLTVKSENRLIFREVMGKSLACCCFFPIHRVVSASAGCNQWYMQGAAMWTVATSSVATGPLYTGFSWREGWAQLNCGPLDGRL